MASPSRVAIPYATCTRLSLLYVAGHCVDMAMAVAISQPCVHVAVRQLVPRALRVRCSSRRRERACICTRGIEYSSRPSYSDVGNAAYDAEETRTRHLLGIFLSGTVRGGTTRVHDELSFPVMKRNFPGEL